jgi:Phage T7 tail fibre protein/Domain of unknown function (DUF1983)
MAYVTKVQYTATAGQVYFDLPFPYLDPSHLHVTVGGNYAEFTMRTASRIRLNFPAPANALVEIQRQTPIDTALVSFQNGSVLTKEDLNTATQQVLFAQQEMKDAYDASLNAALIRVATANGVVVTDPSEVLNALTIEVLGSNILQQFDDKSLEITLNAQAIIEQATHITSLQATIDSLVNFNGTGLQTVIQNEQNQRIAGDQALASTFNILGATASNGLSFILNTNNVKLSSTESLGQRLDTIQTSLNGVSASITSEAVARSQADSSLASQISTINSTLGSNTATITTLQSVTNGLQAKYSVAVDVNGNVSGFSLNSTGAQSAFTVVADRFAIVDPNGGNPTVPFEVSGGIVRIKDAAVSNLSVGSIGSGTYNGVMSMGTGRITFDNGVYMKVMGVGFGTTQQFIEWYGPRQSNFNLCSEANAIYYLKTNGQAYFGGSLSAGTLTTKAATSDTSSAALAETSVFGSNGHQIVVTVSYSYSSSSSSTYPATTSGDTSFMSVVSSQGMTQTPGGDYFASGSTGSSYVDLYRSVNGGAYTLVGTIVVANSWSVSGIRPIIGDAPGSIRFADNVSGSITFSDPQLVALNRQYKAVLRTRTIRFTSNPVQNLSVICVEQ